ncbi:hypothetical protein AAHC03_022806 [Spirometra sp. Aus1]
MSKSNASLLTLQRKDIWMMAYSIAQTFLLIHVTSACFYKKPVDLNPTELTASALSPTSVRLSWKPPYMGRGKLPHFYVLVNGTNNRITWRTKVIIRGLTPHTKYVFGVRTVLPNYDYVRPGIYLTTSTDELGPYESQPTECLPWLSPLCEPS